MVPPVLPPSPGLVGVNASLAKEKPQRAGKPGSFVGQGSRPGNQILRLLPRDAMEALAPALEYATVARHETLFEPGDDVTHVHFPLDSTAVAFVLPMRDGRTVEAATIGREGAVGGIISLGMKPAFTRATVQIPGALARIPIARLEAAKRAAPRIHQILTRYADCLTAQILQSVGCAALHSLEARSARWLLTMHDRLARPELPLTQESLAEMFGVARTYVTRIASKLQDRGAISYRRGVVRIVSRSLLEAQACECYMLIRQHYDRVLPGLYPRVEP
jgi:CRP-like cAMP-binding protein